MSVSEPPIIARRAISFFFFGHVIHLLTLLGDSVPAFSFRVDSRLFLGSVRYLYVTVTNLCVVNLTFADSGFSSGSSSTLVNLHSLTFVSQSNDIILTRVNIVLSVICVTLLFNLCTLLVEHSYCFLRSNNNVPGVASFLV